VLPQTFVAITKQTNHKEIFESVASQRFQKFLWFETERKALYWVWLSIPKNVVTFLGIGIKTK
jgi:hypothetical protein